MLAGLCEAGNMEDDDATSTPERICEAALRAAEASRVRVLHVAPAVVAPIMTSKSVRASGPRLTAGVRDCRASALRPKQCVLLRL